MRKSKVKITYSEEYHAKHTQRHVKDIVLKNRQSSFKDPKSLTKCYKISRKVFLETTDDFSWLISESYYEKTL